MKPTTAAARVLKALLSGPMTISELAVAVEGRDDADAQAVVRVALHRLSKAGSVGRTPAKYHLIGGWIK